MFAKVKGCRVWMKHDEGNVNVNGRNDVNEERKV